MAEKSVNPTTSCTEQRPFKIPQLSAPRAVVNEPAPQKRRFVLLLLLVVASSIRPRAASLAPAEQFTFSLVPAPKGRKLAHSAAPSLPSEPASLGFAGDPNYCPLQRREQRPKSGLYLPGGAGTLPSRHRGTQPLTQPNRGCLCPSARRPRKVGPGFRPDRRSSGGAKSDKVGQALCFPFPAGKQMSALSKAAVRNIAYSRRSCCFMTSMNS